MGLGIRLQRMWRMRRWVAGCALLGISLIYNMVMAWRGSDRGLLVYTRTASEKDAPEVLEL